MGRKRRRMAFAVLAKRANPQDFAAPSRTGGGYKGGMPGRGQSTLPACVLSGLSPAGWRRHPGPDIAGIRLAPCGKAEFHFRNRRIKMDRAFSPSATRVFARLPCRRSQGNDIWT